MTFINMQIFIFKTAQLIDLFKKTLSEIWDFMEEHSNL